MFEPLGKLLKSNGTLILLGIILIPYLIYAVFKSAPEVKHILVNSASTKTLEEIMHPSAPNTTPPQEWDNDFKSSIEVSK